MQELPEASDREKEWRMRKKKRDLQTKGGRSFSFSSDQRSDNTLLTSGRRYAFVFGRRVG